MREKDYKALTREGRELWLFNKLNNYVETPSMNLWLFWIVAVTQPFLYMLAIFMLLMYDGSKYAYMVSYFQPLAMFGMVMVLGGVATLLLHIINLFSKGHKDRCIRRDYTQRK